MTELEQVPLFGTEEKAAENQARMNDLVAATAALRQIEEVPFDIDLDAAAAQVVAAQLVTQKDQGEAQLSYVLSVLRDNRTYLEEGYDTFKDYVEHRLKFSATKACNLAKRWDAFLDLGLSVNVLSGPTGVSWSKFAEFMPAIQRGVITEENIDMWLPMASGNGPLALTNTGIQKFVRSEILALNAETDPDQLEAFTVKMTPDDKAWSQQFINSIQEATGVLSSGEVVRLALDAKVAEIVTDNEDVRANYGIVGLIEMIRRMAPEASVLFTAPPGVYDDGHLGVVPITHVYAILGDEPKFVMANDEEEARLFLGDGDIRAFPLEATVREVRAEHQMELETPEETKPQENPEGDVLHNRLSEGPTLEDRGPTPGLKKKKKTESTKTPKNKSKAPKEEVWEEVDEVGTVPELDKTETKAKKPFVKNERPDVVSLTVTGVNDIIKESVSEMIHRKLITMAKVRKMKTHINVEDELDKREFAIKFLNELFDYADANHIEMT